MPFTDPRTPKPAPALLLLLALCASPGIMLPLHAAAPENQSAAPLSATPLRIRGTLPWHNFLSGPTAWSEDDYRAYLDDLSQKHLNLVGFHCYTGGAERYAPYVEPMIRFEYRNVVPEATWDTSLTDRWGYRPLAIQDFAFGTGALFVRAPGPAASVPEAFGSPAAVTAHNKAERYQKAHQLIRSVVELAHARGIQVAIGFEFGVHPPDFASIVPPESRIPGALLPDPTHPANIEILQSALKDILEEYPGVDWIWLWLHEHSMFVAKPVLKGRFERLYEQEKVNFQGSANEHDIFTGIWSLAQIRQVHAYLAQHSPRTGLVIGGWGGGPQLPPVLTGLDRVLPTNIVFSCLNPDMGTAGHTPVLDSISPHRPVWSMPWLEGDSWLWHLQMRAGSMIDQVKAAAAAHFDGAVAIHWRTEEVRANLEAFALAATDPAAAADAERFYARHCAERYGPESVPEIAQMLLRFERDKKLGYLASPEFYPYDPGWGRISPEFAKELQVAIAKVEEVKQRVSSPQQRANLGWLADNLRFSLLLDQVGRKIEAAYALKDLSLTGEADARELRQRAHEARSELASAPIEELFRTFARRVRSRGELGELSALNQKLWLEYRELERFLERLDSEKSPAHSNRLLIVAPQAFHEALNDFVAHKEKILPTELISLEEVLKQGRGVDDPEKLKRFLYDQWRGKGLGYVLLVGDVDVLPVRFMVLDRVTPAAFDYAFYPSDLYYADLAKTDGTFDDWNAQKEGFHGNYFGEVRGEKNKHDPINYDQIDYRPEIAVGRWPVSNPEEVQRVAAKTIAYEQGLETAKASVVSTAGLLSVGGWVDSRPLLDRLGALLTNAWTVEKRYYSDAGQNSTIPPPNRKEIRGLLDAGVRLLVHTGHGQADAWEQCFSVRDLDSITNGASLPVVISAGCSTAYFAPLPPYDGYVDINGKEHTGTDHGETFSEPPPEPAPYQRGQYNHTGLGEQMLKRNTNGAVAYIGCNTGSQPCALTLVEGFITAVSGADHPRLGDCWASAVGSYYEHEHLADLKPNDDWYPPSIFFQGMKFMLFGDPTLPLAGKGK